MGVCGSRSNEQARVEDSVLSSEKVDLELRGQPEEQQETTITKETRIKTTNFPFFKNLPSSLIYELQQFMDPLNYYHLLSTSKEMNPILRETWIVKLDDPRELELVLAKMDHPRRQLCVYLRDFVFVDSSLVAMEQPSLRLILSQAQNPIIDWKSITETHQIIAAYRNAHFEPFTANSISKNLKELRLYYFSKLSKVDSLAHLKTLVLQDCYQVSNVDCLVDIPSLTLRSCTGVIDVSKLGRINDLTLRDCPGIVDISSLTNNKRLVILYCRSINGRTVRFQKNVRYLFTDLIHTFRQSEGLDNCRLASLFWPDYDSQHDLVKASQRIRHPFKLSSFSHLFEVELDGFPHPEPDFSALYSVPKVSLSKIKQISNLKGLGGNRMVNIHSCWNLNCFAAIKNVPRVIVSGPSDNFVNGEDLCNVFDLTLKDLSKFSDTRALKNVTHLSLEWCVALQELTGLENVSTVTIINCPNLLSLKGLGNNEKIVLERRIYNKLMKKNRKDLGMRNYNGYQMVTHTDEEIVLLSKQL
jgi:hypothetical protein